MSPSSILIYSNKLAFAVIFIIISALVIDTSIIKVYYLNVQQSTSSSIFSVIVFIVISSIYIIGQYFVLGYVNNKSKEVGDYKKLRIKVLHKAVVIVQYGLAAINIFVILQMVIISHYNVGSLIAVSALSYSLSIILMGMLSHRFFSRFRSNRNYVVLLYGLSSAVIAINAAFTLFYVSYMLFLSQPSFICPHLGFFTPFFIPTPLAVTLNFGYVASSIVSFILPWTATAVLLRHYS